MRSTKITIRVLTVVQACLAMLGLAFAQESNDGSTAPTIHAGEWLEVIPRAKIQVDLSTFRPQLEDQKKLLQGRRLRFGIDGTLFRDFAYSARIETRTGEPEFRDLFLKFQRFRTLQIQTGHFKIPFGLDQLTDSGELDFVQRSRIGSIVAPGRDTGAMILGDLLDSRIHYSAGVFRHDGSNTELEEFAAPNESQPGGNGTLAGRFTVQPLKFLSTPTPIRNLQVGAAFTRSDLTTGLSSFTGVTVSNQVFFPRMYTKGTRERRGAELGMTLGPLSIQGEFMDAREQRLEQGLHHEDLPPLKTQGWYLSAVQPLLGRLEPENDHSFLHSLLPGRQLGLFEATMRYEVIRFGSESLDGAPPSRDARAANVIGNAERASTFGINWHANRYVKVQFNGVRETLQDLARTPIEGKSDYWTLVSRLQLYF